MNRKIIIATTACILATQLTACVTYMGMTSSSTPLEGKRIEKNLGPAEGISDKGVSAFGLWSCSLPDINVAINNAIAVHGGDALINVRWYEIYYYGFFVGINQIVVRGDVVKFEPAEADKQPGKPARNR